MMRRLFTFASTPFRAVVLMTALMLVVGWLTGYLRLLDETSKQALQHADTKMPSQVSIETDANIDPAPQALRLYLD
jgi:hypothetical protein